jgi:hypothetical protein
MRKLRLTLDDLAVESFDPTPLRAQEEGTVRGREESEDSGYNTMCGTCRTDCGTCYTVNYTCEGHTCGDPTCDWGWNCPQTYGVTCPVECQTQGVIC